MERHRTRKAIKAAALAAIERKSAKLLRKWKSETLRAVAQIPRSELIDPVGQWDGSEPISFLVLDILDNVVESGDL